MIAVNELGQVVNETGQVALRYMTQQQAYASCNSHEYVFTIRGQVTLAFVEPSDVDCMLAIRRGCNCGSGKKNVIFLADERHTKMWVAGGGRGD